MPCTRHLASVSPPVFSSKMRTNSSPIALRFASGSVTPASASKNRQPGVDVDQLDAHVAPERLDDLIALALAHQSGVDVDAGQLMADRPVHERRRDRRVDAAREPADDPVGRRPGRGSAATCSSITDDIVQSAAIPASSWRNRAQHRHAVRRVDHLGVELHAVDAALVVLEHRDRSAGRGRGGGEAGGRLGDARRSGSSTRRARQVRRRAGAATVPVRVMRARPYSPCMPRPTTPPSCWAISWAP